jgi:hypothetical protein
MRPAADLLYTIVLVAVAAPWPLGYFDAVLYGRSLVARRRLCRRCDRRVYRAS